MSKQKNKSDAPAASSTPTTVIGMKRVRKKYSLGDDYQAWKEHCDSLKNKSAFHSSEATRYRNEHKKYYENGASGFCNERDDKEWEKANNLITIAELKESDRGNAWKDIPVSFLDISQRLKDKLKENDLVILCNVATWINGGGTKLKGISNNSKEVISDALNRYIAPYHQPILQQELDQAKKILSDLSQ
jgi:hypothetical protein